MGQREGPHEVHPQEGRKDRERIYGAEASNCVLLKQVRPWPVESSKVSDVNIGNADGEVEALGAALDLMKKEAENGVIVHKHALNKKQHADSPALDSYDPAVKFNILCYSTHSGLLNPPSKGRSLPGGGAIGALR